MSPFAVLYGQGEGDAVSLPHDAIISLPRSADVAGSGFTGYFPGGAFEYSKTFEVPEEWREKRVSLQFQGVYRDAMVFVNGAFAGQRPNGYTPFRTALDPFLRYGETNTIRVDARTHEDSRWYSGAGIHRDVVLEVTELVHIEQSGLRITTPDIDEQRAVIAVVTPVKNDSITTATVRVRTELRAPDGSVVASDSAPVTLRPTASSVVRQRLYVTKPALWGVDTPNLYVARTILEDADHIQLEEKDTPFGIRSVQLDPWSGLRINGETVKLRGACVHHDNGLLGAAAIGRAEERRVELLKKAGFNAIRSAHNPISPAMLDACDRLGMLVMDETTDVWTEAKTPFDYSLAFPEWWERDIESLIEKDFNHPSVIFYSIGNEIFETGNPLGSEWGRALAEKVRTLDDTRLVTNGINPFVSVLTDLASQMASADSESPTEGGVNAAINLDGMMEHVSTSDLATERTEASFAALDVAGVNYAEGRYELDRVGFPNRIMVGTETFGPSIATNWRLVLNNPHVLGDFTWTGWDYLGEVGIGRTQYADDPAWQPPYPWMTAWVGDIDITGHRRPLSYYREIVFGLRTEPYIAVLRPENHGREIIPGKWGWSDSISSWSWDVRTGAPIVVEVYSDADDVELVLNGHPVGRTTPGASVPFLASFDITYEPGTLEAVTYRDGVEVGRTALRSADKSADLAVTPDRTELLAGDRDLSFIEIELRDQAGNLASARDVPVKVSVEGAGTLLAFGSGRPDTAEPLNTDVHTTFDGRALAIVRPTGVGVIEVTVSAEGFDAVTTSLHVSDAADRSARPE
ncbi:glycoside hydrolase family 2 TIM barrel-domain containing protein [Microbacterium sp. CGR2]|uniref:glycoside hydrolase family 2 TIM barrel-domain containing protein n=2 Tax=unclassified Microbacterium TaxID=2609290 RepID=UPI00217E9F43|nr:glycoside hydrolase family 2 TIM barrel-domain containing protein [Microbacterium sp. CGR2]